MYRVVMGGSCSKGGGREVVQLISGALDIPYGKFMVCVGHNN